MPLFNTNENKKIKDSKLPKNQLGSIQRSTIVHVLGEGEIEGFPSANGTRGSNQYNRTALRDVFLNDTQVLQQTKDGTRDGHYNFQDIKFEPRFGTSDQSFVKGLKNIQANTKSNLKDLM